MLELRPSCEHCGKDLPPNSLDAMICTFECTYCRTCAIDLFENVCPNCTGNFQPRPIRPRHHLQKNPGSIIRIEKPKNMEDLKLIIAANKGLPPEER